MTNACCTCAAALVLVITSTAHAQIVTRAALSPPEIARWDIAGHAAWLGVNESEVTASWDRWFSAGAIGGSLGRYVGPHLKIDIDLSIATEGHAYGQSELVTLPGSARQIALPREHYFRTTTVSTSLVYQLFENRW